VARRGVALLSLQRPGHRHLMARTRGVVTRRAFRNASLRSLFDRMREADWSAEYEGSGHIRMTSPDGKTFLSMSQTAGDDARGLKNAEAVFKRWIRLQNTITRVSGLYPAPPVHEDEPMGQDLHALSEAEADAAEAIDAIIEEEPPDESLIENGKPVFFCADGCGKPVSKQGGYARGHNPNSQHNAAKARAAKVKRGPSLFKTNGMPVEQAPDTFTVDDVITIATFAGQGGLVEIDKLKEGLNLILTMRGER
jgi:hypothetical protein